MYVYTLIYTHTYTRTHIYTNPWKGFQCSLSYLKAIPTSELHSTPVWFPFYSQKPLLHLCWMIWVPWINKLHSSSQLKIKEAIQFKMPLKINIMSVWGGKKSKFGETVLIFSLPYSVFRWKYTWDVSGKTPTGKSSHLTSQPTWRWPIWSVPS